MKILFNKADSISVNETIHVRRLNSFERAQIEVPFEWDFVSTRFTFNVVTQSEFIRHFFVWSVDFDFALLDEEVQLLSVGVAR